MRAFEDSEPAVESHPLVSVIIPTLNEEKVIGECLKALVLQQWPGRHFEVIVVDNGSVDRTIDVVREFIDRLNLTVHTLPDCHIAELRNAGALDAKGSILAFLDSDCIAPATWLTSAVSILQGADDTVIGSFYTIPENSGWVARAWYGDMPKERRGPVSYVPSGTLFVSRTGFWRIGGFDAELETSEDFEFCQRAKASGYKVLAHSELSTIHLGTPQTLSAFWRKERWHGSGMREVLFGSSSQRGFRNTLLLTLYTAFSMALTLLAVPVALMSGRFAFLAAGPALLGVGAAVMAARSSIRRGCWRYFLPLAALYVVYGIARSVTLLGLSGKTPRRSEGSPASPSATQAKTGGSQAA